jgi:methionyl-tRNA synthetase
MAQTSLPKRRMIVTGALPYANGSIHIGHLVEYLQADIWTRFQKMQGHDCAYMCADDTHGTPIMVKARELGITPEELIARSHKEHFSDFKDFGIEFDLYSSTHSAENKALAEEFYIKMRDGGHTATREIQQLYCTHDKMFLPDRFVKGTCPVCSSNDQYGDSCDKCGSTYSPAELKSPHCSICGTPPVFRASEHVFFKLNDFHAFLREWVPEHTQKDVSAKLLEWFNEDLRDWDISRDAPYFGFEIPGFPGKYFYVWLDAPIGYVSATLQWCQANGRDFASYWRDKKVDGKTESPADIPAEIYHFIGKDITYFHCLFWPAMLKAAGFKLPTQVFVHGHLTVNGEKMSKSKGTSITARTYLNHLDPMYLRYYYACKINSTVGDIDLNITDFVNRVNSDLIGKITNLASRGAQMLVKRAAAMLGDLPDDGRALVEHAQSRSELIAAHYEGRDYAKAITEIRDLADQANQYFDAKAPWTLIKTDLEATRGVLTTTLNLFRLLAIYLKPVLPAYSEKVAQLLNEGSYAWGDAQKVIENTRVCDYEHLATRVEIEKFEQIIADSRPPETEVKSETPKNKQTKSTKAVPSKTASSASPGTSASIPAAAPRAADSPPDRPVGAPVETTLIDFEDFAKIDLRIARILEAEEIKEADKLLRLKIDLGPMGQRQIIAGIKSAYRAQDLIGRHTIVVANLKPRKMKFGISEGMVLAAGPGGSELYILSPDEGAVAGQKVK